MLFKNKKHKPAGLTIAYLLEDTSLCGGVKVVFDHARLLSQEGFAVTIITKGNRPEWYDLSGVTFVQIENNFPDIREYLSSFSLVIATSYSHVLELYNSSVNLAHFTQGYEEDHPYWNIHRNDIRKAYQLPVQKITISRRVAFIVKEQFSQSAFFIPQGIDIRLFHKRKPVRRIEKVVLVGTWENEIKGIQYAVKGFLMAKQKNKDLHLVRVSTLPLSEQERDLYPPDEYYTAVFPKDMGNIYRQCDLAIVPSLEGEGFGLPAVEAMACGLPVILTKIYAFLSLDSAKDYAYFVSPASAQEISDGILHLCREPELGEILSKRATEVAEQFSMDTTKERLVKAIQCIIDNPQEKNRENVTFIYIQRPRLENSMEDRLLRELSKETFGDKMSVRTIISENSADITVGDILKKIDDPFIAVSMDDTLYYSENWLYPLIKALETGLELAAPVCSTTFEVDIPYYSPLTLNETAERMRQKYEGDTIPLSQSPLLAFLTRTENLAGLNPATPLSELPQKLNSALVPSSLVHWFGDFYSSKRDDLVPFIPYGVKKVLDVGCARGFLGEMIKKERGCEVFGVELNKNMAEDAKTRLDDVFCIDIQEAQLPFSEDLDIIIFADILEHLTNPWHVLKKAGTWLKPDGMVIASIPNTAHYSIILDLLRGRWDYIPVGLLCITHLRFFTKKSIEDMFIKSGYSTLTIAPQVVHHDLKEKLAETLDRVIRSENASREIFCPGYYVVAKKSILSQ
jgi:glycosyltransferase involved in cell wall biosynthesis/2-polyprenyl-3-methyl-5-hydroxy-6-metoxy-1,4-benzoquinol methylase